MRHLHRSAFAPAILMVSVSALVLAIATSAAIARSAADSEIEVTLGKPGELKIRASARTAKAGEVSFTVSNRGKLVHEFILLRTKTLAAKLKPRAEEPQKVVEPGFQVELEDIEPGQKIIMALPLKPGHYILLCNVDGHHAGGMRADLNLR